MRYTVIVHIANEDPFLADLERLPEPTDTSLTFVNVRRRDGRPVHYLTPDASSIIFPMHRITFIEVMTGKETEREVAEFFREG